MKISQRSLQLAENDGKQRVIDEITCAEFDIDGRREKVFGYIIRDLAYDIILGKPWMEHNDVVYLAKKRVIRFGSKKYGQVVRELGWYENAAPESLKKKIQHVATARKVIRTKFISLMNLARKEIGSRIFAISMEDINKALETTSEETLDDVEKKLPHEIKHWSRLFIEDNESKLPPHRPSDMKIEPLKGDKGRGKQIPWGPLYGMSRDELLVLRKTLNDHLEKGWIRASSSPGGAPVLFDRYPLPLIRENLSSISKSTWITKVDIRAAFHKLRVRKVDEEKTAFRTRFGSFEWLVTPFGLQRAPAAFQRYINESLGDYLDQFCTAYLDDILIYTSGDLNDHWVKFEAVFERLNEAGLKLDPKKCEFGVKSTKYFGFVISLGEGIKVDPEKVVTIKSWETPTSVKGVRSFLGFANFYREFIPNFREIARPLLDPTKKDRAFIWLKEHQKSFDDLMPRINNRKQWAFVWMRIFL
ncbi:hypothetical protein K3495_g7894 [Podosphaera aphanis]|nr:hypothetical protein K3495_g7894 [Podosphaera aphanis]